jgi:hypothetical protein
MLMRFSFRACALCVLAATVCLSPVRRLPAADAPIDWNRARELHQKAQRGESLTSEEKSYYERAKAARAQGQTSQAPPNAPAKWTQHLIPLTELGTEKYKGQEGGLYGGGRNQPPRAHLEAALKEAAKIQPLDADGKPAKDGKIVLLGVGMSNTTMEYSRFKQLADADPAKAPRLVIVDGAQGGQDARKTSDPDAEFWRNIDGRLKASGVTAKQVQAVWLKQAMIGPRREFPAEAQELQGHLAKILAIIKQRYPNARLGFLSSRTYAGYATTPLNPEPHAYESAFAVRWLIEDQIAGKPELNCDPSRGEVKAPLLLWGPYLWADGETPRKADGFTYSREDVTERDGTHPSNSGRQKVAGLLLNFFKNDPAAKNWFRGENPPRS